MVRPDASDSEAGKKNIPVDRVFTVKEVAEMLRVAEAFSWAVVGKWLNLGEPMLGDADQICGTGRCRLLAKQDANPASAVLSNRLNNPLRSPRWRWFRARQLVSERDRLRRDLDDVHVATARSFCLSLSRCETEDDLLTLLHRYPGMYDAWALWKASDGPQYREELEARILARATTKQIAAKTGISEEVIDAYERTFFDVRDRLDFTSFIVYGVIKPTLMRGGVGSSTTGSLWKLYGYFSGPYVLDALINGFCNPQRPESADQLNKFWIEEGKRLLAMKGALAMRGLEINDQTQARISGLFFRLLKLEKKKRASGGNGSTDYSENVKAFLDDFPWKLWNATDAWADIPAKQPEQSGVSRKPSVPRSDRLNKRFYGTPAHMTF